MSVLRSLPMRHVDARTRAAWHTQVAAARHTPGLLPLLVRQRHLLLPRFATVYHQLRALPKRVRRWLHRHGHTSLGGLALLLTLGQAPAGAVTIPVDGTICTLVDAITAANTNALVGGCDGSASTGADTLMLQPSSVHTLTAVHNDFEGATGLPVVRSAITIAGNQSTIHRDSGASPFRLLAVTAPGDLLLKDTRVSGGVAGDGGGILNSAGRVTLERSTLSGNTASSGGGVSNRAGELTLTDTLLSGNTAAALGGGVFSFNAYPARPSIVTITASTLSGNTAAEGGGVANIADYGGTSRLTITNSTLSGNTASSGGGVSNRAGELTLTDTLLSGNTAAALGGGVFNFNGHPGQPGMVTITASTLSGNTAAAGGGVFNQTFRGSYGAEHSIVTITASTLSGNTASSGGGVFNFAYGRHQLSTVMITASTLAGNSAAEGGGVFNRTDYGGSSGLTITASTLAGNAATAGGGVLNHGGTKDFTGGKVASTLITASTLSGNTAAAGGGVLNRTDDGGVSTVTITASTLAGNAAASGGGVFNHAGTFFGQSTMTITASTLSGNAAAEGGGVFNFADSVGGVSTLTITASTLSGNAAAEGGGVFNMADSEGTSRLTLTNSTLAGNTASRGGGVLNQGGMPLFGDVIGASTLITASTLSGNAAAEGGGVFNASLSDYVEAGTLTLTRSLLVGNTAPSGAEVRNVSGTLIANNHNLLGHSGLTNAHAFTDFLPGATDRTATRDGTTPTALQAIMTPTLAPHGGPTETHALVPGSPALDASPADADCPPTDQRGVPRPQGPACDIGAFERAAALLPVVIDVKPDSFPNRINPRSRGKLAVAIVTTATVDATTVAAGTVRLGVTGTEAAPVQSALEDSNGDGAPDLLLHFPTQETGIRCGATEVLLTGETVDGQALVGSDAIQTVGCTQRRP